MASSVALIPARSGSKGIKRKNVKPFAGLPLIHWTIRAAISSGCFERVIVSTDDEEIFQVARKAGPVDPIWRPASLADDSTPMVDTVLHALELLPGIDSIMLLQPTSPLRDETDIVSAFNLLAGNEVDSVVSVVRTFAKPFWMFRLAEDNRISPLFPDYPLPLRRQEHADLFALNGAIYLARPDWIATRKKLFSEESKALVMESSHSLDLDSDRDWTNGEKFLQDGVVRWG